MNIIVGAIIVVAIYSIVRAVKCKNECRKLQNENAAKQHYVDGLEQIIKLEKRKSK